MPHRSEANRLRRAVANLQGRLAVIALQPAVARPLWAYFAGDKMGAYRTWFVFDDRRGEPRRVVSSRVVAWDGYNPGTVGRLGVRRWTLTGERD